MKLTIGMACCGNFEEAWFTVQALRIFHDLTDTEIVVVDQSADDRIKNFVASWAHRQVRHVAMPEPKGTSAPRDRIFAEAKGEWVLVIDSHVLLPPGVVARFREWAAAHPTCTDLLHGPMLYDSLDSAADAMSDEWRGQMWGTWRGGLPSPEADAYEIPMHGMGLWASRRDSWLGFNPEFRGFGGEEGYIHAKYRKAGRRVLCLPFLRWLHHFRQGATPYPLRLEDRIHNYRVGHAELGLDPARFLEHFKIPA